MFDNPPTPELQAAKEYLLQHPPKKQVIRNGVLDWDEGKPQGKTSDSELVLLYVRRVRNNLFHGGKFNGNWFHPERSKELLQHSLAILEACLNESPEINEAYYTGIDLFYKPRTDQ